MNTQPKINNKRTVLIIEDNDLNRELLKEILEEDYNVLEAVNGKEGLDLVALNYRDISLIMLDIQMPIMNGYEFLTNFTTFEQYSSIPIIVISGSSLSEETKCLELGANDFITKPYVPDVILKRVASLIRLKESITLLEATKYDSLTKIYSKNMFLYHATNLIKNINNTYNMLLIKLNDFDYINHLYGEEISDNELKSIAKSLVDNFDGKHLYGKVSADMFAIMYEEDKDAVKEMINLFELSANKYSYIKNIKFSYAIYNRIDKELSANSVLFRLISTIAKVNNKYKDNIIEFDKASIETLDFNHYVLENMEAALENNEFKVFYQPKHDASSHKLIGAEALIRWFSPIKGVIPPFKFIDIFEDTGFITNVDLFVLETVCKNLRGWIDNNTRVVPVSVNLSRKDLINIKDVKILSDIVDKYNIPYDLIHFEITESLCDKGEDVLEKARQIKDTGFKIEIDDFGSGYSSLGILKDIPMDYIKLDMQFARTIEKQKEVTDMIIALGHKLGVKIIAEGVEDINQLNTLRDINCDYIQGYYFSKPICFDDFCNYLVKEK